MIPPKRRDFLLPVLASVYLPLFLAARIPRELISGGDLIRPVGITLLVAATTFAVALAVTRTFEKAAIASVLVVLPFDVLGILVQRLQATGADRVAGGLVGLVCLCLLATGALQVAVVAVRRPLGTLVRVLFMMTGFLVGWNAALLGWRTVRPGPAPAHPLQNDISAGPVAGDYLPDLYLIVLDKYEGSEGLLPEFGFDNSYIEDSLRARGLIVPDRPRANYVHTFLSIASMLDLGYLGDLGRRFEDDSRWEIAYPMIENSRLLSFLRQRGYRFVFFPTEFWGTRQNRLADVQMPRPRDIRNELLESWTRVTAVAPIQALACRRRECDEQIWPYAPAGPVLMDWRFEQLGRLGRESKGPTFVFAHLLLPHEPNIYGPECQHRPTYWPLGVAVNAHQMERAYVEQVRCVNRKLLTLVDAIRRQSKRPVVIVITGDHGHGHVPQLAPVLAQVGPVQLRGRPSIFAAFQLPGVPADSVPPGVTPINVLRLVLRHYFHADLPALPNVTYWSSSDRPYRFELIPNPAH